MKNKKALISTFLFVGLLLPAVGLLAAFDDIPNSCNISNELVKSFSEKNLKCKSDCKLDGTLEHGDCGLCCFFVMVYKITNWIFYIITVIAILLFVYGGMTYMTALGDPDKAKKGRSIIIYAMIGLLIALLAKIVPDIVISIVK